MLRCIWIGRFRVRVDGVLHLEWVLLVAGRCGVASGRSAVGIGMILDAIGWVNGVALTGSRCAAQGDLEVAPPERPKIRFQKNEALFTGFPCHKTRSPSAGSNAIVNNF